MILGRPVDRVLHPPKWPRPNGNIEYRVTQRFGCTGVGAEPKLGSCAHFHRGLDLGNGQCGGDVLAAESGEVQFAGELGNGELVVILDHGQGWGTSYGHLKRIRVAKDQKVTKGQHIGDVGDTGFAQGCHLHFAVKSGLAVGWTKLDFIPNAFGGRGDTTGKWQDPWPLLEQNAGGVPPDTPQEGHEMPTPSEYIPGQIASIGNAAGAVNVRAAPRLGADVIRQIPAGKLETWAVTCWEKGDLESGSDRWLCRWANGRWEYVHKINVVAGPAPSTVDSTSAVKAATDPLVAKVNALKHKVAAFAAEIAEE